MGTSSTSTGGRRRLAVAVAAVTGLMGVVLAVSTPAAAAVPHRVTAAATTASVDVGGRVYFIGTVPTAPVGQLVLLERRVGTTWALTDFDTTNAAREFVMAPKVTAVGFQQFRVRVPASVGRAQALSGVVRQTVYAWHYLADLTPLAAPPTIATRQPALATERPVRGAVRIAGVTYSRSVALGAGPLVKAEYDLRRGCVQFDASVGVTDATTNPAYGARRRLVLDQNVPGFELGSGGRGVPAVRFVRALNGYGLLALTSEAIPDASSLLVPAQIGFGNARIRCVW